MECLCPKDAYDKNPEIIISLPSLIGSAAKWIYIFHPYQNPLRFDEFVAIISREFIEQSETKEALPHIWIRRINYVDIEPWLKEWFNNHIIFKNWNVPQNSIVERIDQDSLFRNIAWELYLTCGFQA
jgi:hypothetical protein